MEVNVFFCFHLRCGRRKGKERERDDFFYRFLFFHCGVVRDKGNLKGFFL